MPVSHRPGRPRPLKPEDGVEIKVYEVDDPKMVQQQRAEPIKVRLGLNSELIVVFISIYITINSIPPNVDRKKIILKDSRVIHFGIYLGCEYAAVSGH